ncbi:MAG: L-histidine N(alpha)-methyltransferase [Hyphomicrobiaceae bacterium]
MGTHTNSNADATDADFAEAVINGLTGPARAIPSRFLYDARGSRLFEEITDLDEYYPTRTEMELLARHAPCLADKTPPGSALVEFGSGSSRKTEILLESLPEVSVYLPIDVSATALSEAEQRLTERFPDLKVISVVGDFCQPLDLPEEASAAPRLGFFPGSTIGNLMPDEARGLLAHFGEVLGHGARLVVGVDLKKDTDILHSAYNDERGVTAQFNLNLLHRINRELGGDFDVDRFEHVALYNDDLGRIEMHIEAKAPQTVNVLGHEISFRAGDRIHTENSYKYTRDQFSTLATDSGWSPADVWIDDGNLFSVHELVRTD